ncbi:MAG: glycosyltransferase [Mesorhizobium sp.]|nr:MAG: glycosyltransferase [Mesorhizobium sp.]
MPVVRVAFATSWLSKAGGGVSVVVEALSRNLADAGLEVSVFGLEDRLWLDGDREAWSGAPARALPVLGPAALGYAPEMARRIIEWAPDVVHLHGLWVHPSRSVLQWSRSTGRPYMISPHGMLGSAALRYSRSKKRLISALYQNAVFASARSIHVTSEQEHEEVREYGLSHPVAIIPNGIVLPSAATRASRNEAVCPYVLSLGRVHPKKGLDRLIIAWKDIELSFPNWHLRIVGPDEVGHTKALRELADNAGLKNVHFESPVYGDAKYALMRDAEVFVLPTLNDNFALTVAESLACRTPVISTKGAPWHGLDDNRCGWWIDHGIEPLSATLRQAMSLTSEQRHAMGARGAEWVARDFCWPAIAQSLVGVYRWLNNRTAEPPCVRID